MFQLVALPTNNLITKTFADYWLECADGKVCVVRHNFYYYAHTSVLS